MSNQRITFVSADDWEGVYAGEDLLIEGHSVTARGLAHALGFYTYGMTANHDWLHSIGRLPEKLAEVVEEEEDDN